MRRGIVFIAGACIALSLVFAPLAGAEAPGISISAPANPSNSSSGTISFSVSGDPDTIACTVDGGSVPCSSTSASYSGLGDGSHSFGVQASNVDGSDSASVSWVIDTTPPSLSVSNIQASVNDVTSTSVSYSGFISTSDAHSVTVNCTPPSGSTFNLGGPYSVSCTATDSLNNTSAPKTFTVTVADTTPPSITVPSNIVDSANGGKAETFTASASGGFTTSCNPASGSVFPIGVTTVTCTATDASGNTGSGTFTVTLNDTIPPVVNVVAPAPKESPLGTSQPVTFSATATDGATPLTPTCSPASGFSFPMGSTHVTCTATDGAGNTGSAGIDVVVQDTTAPTVSINSGPSGTTNATSASFGFSTNEGTTTCSLDGGAFTACSASASFSSLGDGSHTFQVKATDTATNTGSASRTWTVDLTPPTFTAPSAVVAEANGPAGSIVTYSVTAADNGVPLLPSAVVCSPASGTKFPIATTTVNCSATDPYGNVGSKSFTVQVRDTSPPRIAASDITVTAKTQAGISKDDQPIGPYLESLRATDLVTPVIRVFNDAPDVFPIGKTSVRLTARDDAKNSARRTIVVTVLPVGQEAPPPPDLAPPADVTGLTATPSDHTITLAWTSPSAKDLASIDVRMSESTASGTGRLVSRGLHDGVVLRGLKNGVEYRFEVISVDDSGNQSRGVVVLGIPEAKLLVSPRAGTKVTGPPLLRWAPVPNAAYYNVQLFKGKTKVLSAWPTRAQLKLGKSWTFANVKRKLELGTYTWYVWPGFGPRGDATYGKLRGKSSFVVVKPAKPANPA